jgi:hypothetical protein
VGRDSSADEASRIARLYCGFAFFGTKASTLVVLSLTMNEGVKTSQTLKAQVTAITSMQSALGSLCATPQSRTGANGLAECARQMALIRKSASAGDPCESLVGS